jgi:hypothetical protein
MSFTDSPGHFICARDTLQIFSIKIASTKGGLRWPLDVFGVVAARDVLDKRKQNIIYARARSNYQTITEEVTYLYALTNLYLFCHPSITMKHYYVFYIRGLY